MPNTYSSFELAKHIKFDEDVTSCRLKSVADSKKNIIWLDIKFITYAIVLFIIITLLAIAAVFYFIATIPLFAMLYGLVSYYSKLCDLETQKNKYYEDIKNGTQSLTEANSCTKLAKLLKEHPEFNYIREAALAQGRQLYVFDLEIIQKLVNDKLDKTAVQIEQESCKEIHGLNLA